MTGEESAGPAGVARPPAKLSTPSEDAARGGVEAPHETPSARPGGATRPRHEAPPGPRPPRPALLAALEREQRRASAQGVLFGQAVADRLGINHSDLESLDLLRWAGPVTAGRLAELTGLTTGAVTRMIDRLERDGFVRREPDPADRRRVIVRPIPAAEQRVAPLYEPLGRAMQAVTDRYTDDQLAVLLDFSTRAFAVMQQETARLRAQADETPGAPGGFVAPLGRAAAGHLVFPAGAFQVTLDAQAGLPDLARATFEGPEPRVRATQEVVVIDYRQVPFVHRDSGAAVVLKAD